MNLLRPPPSSFAYPKFETQHHKSKKSSYLSSASHPTFGTYWQKKSKSFYLMSSSVKKKHSSSHHYFQNNALFNIILIAHYYYHFVSFVYYFFFYQIWNFNLLCSTKCVVLCRFLYVCGTFMLLITCASPSSLLHPLSSKYAVL